uniref:Putative secreted protein n=1 Tax=Panstrongylus lignarius TaxID=156445 RepID=A0A224XS09_9HEMI
MVQLVMQRILLLVAKIHAVVKLSLHLQKLLANRSHFLDYLVVVYNRLLYSPWTCDSVTARHGEPPAGHLPGQLVDFPEEYVNLTEED